MYTALIVDDEIYAVMGIKSGIHWQELQVSEVYEAFNMRDALQVFERTRIDIMICDIEMPKGTGIELLERVNDISPDTETIFLTAHSAYDFMKRAIQLDGFDYLLKPIEFDVLQATIAKALHAIKEERELRHMREHYKPYYELWRKKKVSLRISSGTMCSRAESSVLQRMLRMFLKSMISVGFRMPTFSLCW